MKRREFLKISGATMAGSMLSACTGDPERLIPFLIPPDDGSIPGEAVSYAGACRQCGAGCGTVVRVAEGRAKKVEGNPLHPLNRGKLCARGQAAVQALYHPDRVLTPLKRTGQRGSGTFVPVSWAEAFAMVSERLTAIRGQGAAEQFLMMTPRLGRGTRKRIVTTFMQALGFPLHVQYEFSDPVHHQAAAGGVYGVAGIPVYDLAETQFLLSFGADFLEFWHSPVHYGQAFGEMRQGRTTVRGTYTYAGARLSMTAASADRWLPVKPGGEGFLAMAMARVIVQEGLFDPRALERAGRSREDVLTALSPFEISQAEEKTGIPASDIVSTARGFATVRPSLAIAGDAVAAHTGGAAALEAVHLLNVLVGNIGIAGGVLAPAEQGPPGESEVRSLDDALAALRREKVRLALVHGCDPLYEIPPSTGFGPLFERIPFIVSCSSFMDETALQADLILPDRTDLESWDDVYPSVGLRRTAVGLLQPAVRPLGDTRQFGDALLGIARGVGGDVAAALPAPSYREMVRETIRTLTGGAGGPAFETRWEQALQKGGIFGEPQGDLQVIGSAGFRVPELGPPSFEGPLEEFPLHLVVYPSPALGEGRVAHNPWLQELPDPLSTAVWDNAVEINPATAARYGIGQGDLVAVESPAGTLSLPAVVQPGIRPDTVAIPLGRGHRDRGRFARGRGANPAALLVLPEDRAEGAFPWGQTRVRLARISADGGLVLGGHPEGGHRGELLEI